MFIQLLKLTLILIYLIEAAEFNCLSSILTQNASAALRPMASALLSKTSDSSSSILLPETSPEYEAEQAYKKYTAEPLRLARSFGKADIVVCIPFINEADTIGNVVEKALEGLKTHFSWARVVLLCCGEYEGSDALETVKEFSLDEYPNVKKIAFLKKSDLIKGKGWSVRAMMEIADVLKAHRLFLDADLKTEDSKGLNPEWIKLLLGPILEKKADIVLPKYITPYYSGIISSNFINPLFSSVYGKKVPWPISKEFAISRDMAAKLRAHIRDPKLWRGSVGRYGINTWLISQAIVNEANIKVTEVGLRGHEKHHRKLDERLKAVIETVFDEFERNSSWWLSRYEKDEAIYTLPVLPPKKKDLPEVMRLNVSERIRRYKKGFDIYHSLYKDILPAEIFKELESLREKTPRDFNLSSEMWAKIVYYFLLTYRFHTPLRGLPVKESRQLITKGLIPLYSARVATFAKEIESHKSTLKDLTEDEKESKVYGFVKQLIDNQADDFINQRDFFFRQWQEEATELEPYLPLEKYYESVPGVQLIGPPEMTRPDGEVVHIQDINSKLSDLCFKNFVELMGRIGLSQFSSSEEVAQALRRKIQELEKGLADSVLCGSLQDVEDVKRITETIFSYVRPVKVLGLSNDTCKRILDKFTPEDLMRGFGCSGLDLDSFRKKIKREYGLDYDYEDILALASWTEEKDYRDSVFFWMREQIREKPELIEFGEKEIKPLVVDQSLKPFRSIAGMKEQTGLPRLVGRVVVSSLAKGEGGEFPKIRYLTVVAKSIVELERFSKTWERFKEDYDFEEFVEKTLNSVEFHFGYWKALSAHNMFENGNQMEARARLGIMADDLSKEPELEPLSQLFTDLLSGYFCCLTLQDGGFVPCSLWTWASHSFGGGTGMPDPALHVERDWISWQFLVMYLKEAGLGDEETVNEKIIELMGEGRESASLGVELLGLTPETEDALVAEKRRVGKEPMAGVLHRLNDGKPILEPIKEHWWESKYVLNPAALILKEKDVKDIGRFEYKGMIYIIYRAVGNDGVTSRLGLAWTRDGVNILGRLPFPIFWPRKDYEGINYKDPKHNIGCEDPRIVTIGDRIYMLYTAVDEKRYQIALASISIERFLEAIEASTEDNWQEAWKDAWDRYGLVFPNYPDKDATLLPELFEGKHLIFHRMEPGISASFHDKLECPWPRREFKILVPPRSVGRTWYSQRLGEGANPIKTKYGWLHIIHGADRENKYSLGVRLTSLSNPLKTPYVSPNAILKPEGEYEEGKDKTKYWKENVVFTCGVVPLSDKEELDEDDEILIFYGAADTNICAAKAKVGELIPEEVRNRSLDSQPDTSKEKHPISQKASSAGDSTKGHSCPTRGFDVISKEFQIRNRMWMTSDEAGKKKRLQRLKYVIEKTKDMPDFLIKRFKDKKIISVIVLGTYLWFERASDIELLIITEGEDELEILDRDFIPIKELLKDKKASLTGIECIGATIGYDSLKKLDSWQAYSYAVRVYREGITIFGIDPYKPEELSSCAEKIQHLDFLLDTSEMSIKELESQKLAMAEEMLHKNRIKERTTEAISMLKKIASRYGKKEMIRSLELIAREYKRRKLGQLKKYYQQVREVYFKFLKEVMANPWPPRGKRAESGAKAGKTISKAEEFSRAERLDLILEEHTELDTPEKLLAYIKKHELHLLDAISEEKQLEFLRDFMFLRYETIPLSKKVLEELVTLGRHCGKRIERIREARTMKPKDVLQGISEKVKQGMARSKGDIDDSTYSDIERTRGIPALHHLFDIARELKVDPIYIIDETDWERASAGLPDNEKMKLCRRRKGWTQEDCGLAFEKAGLDFGAKSSTTTKTSWVSACERGKIIPTFKQAEVIRKVFCDKSLFEEVTKKVVVFLDGIAHTKIHCFFAKHPEVSGMTPSEIERDYNISAVSIRTFLRKYPTAVDTYGIKFREEKKLPGRKPKVTAEEAAEARKKAGWEFLDGVLKTKIHYFFAKHPEVSGMTPSEIEEKYGISDGVSVASIRAFLRKNPTAVDTYGVVYPEEKKLPGRRPKVTAEEAAAKPEPKRPRRAAKAEGPEEKGLRLPRDKRTSDLRQLFAENREQIIGMTINQIAELLNKSPSTIRNFLWANPSYVESYGVAKGEKGRKRKEKAAEGERRPGRAIIEEPEADYAVYTGRDTWECLRTPEDRDLVDGMSIEDAIYNLERICDKAEDMIEKEASPEKRKKIMRQWRWIEARSILRRLMPLVSTELCDWDSPEIGQKVAEITKGIADDSARVENIQEWVKENIKLVPEYDGCWDMKAAETLSLLKGTHFNRANLTVAMLRSIGIPARYRIISFRKEKAEDMVSKGTVEPQEHIMVEALITIEGYWNEITGDISRRCKWITLEPIEAENIIKSYVVDNIDEFAGEKAEEYRRKAKAKTKGQRGGRGRANPSGQLKGFKAISSSA